eukprot:scaffold96751_cov52-Cyclotella_meneghiniana.AAC.1
MTVAAETSGGLGLLMPAHRRMPRGVGERLGEGGGRIPVGCCVITAAMMIRGERWEGDRPKIALLATRLKGRQFEEECNKRYAFCAGRAEPVEERGAVAPPTSSDSKVRMW